MTNGRRRATRGTARRNGPAGRQQQQRGRRQQPARGAANGNYGPAPAGIGGMHPALLAGLIVVPLLLIVAIIMALGDGSDEPARNDTPLVDDKPAVIAPPPIVHETQPDAPKYVAPPTKAQMDVLERNWAPLRPKFKEMLRLRDEGVAFWQKQDHERAQDKLHAAKDVFNEMRDTAQELLTGGFTDEQYERYLDDYDTELAKWSREFATFAKYLTVRDD